MGRRTNTARWLETQSRWQVNVQKDGVRRSFTSAKPGRAGQREANAKADAWLDDCIDNTSIKVSALYADFIASKKESTSKSNWSNIEYRYNDFVAPLIGRKKIAALTEQDLQDIINKAFKTKDLSTKSLRNLKGDLTAFCKYCRMKKASTLFPENLTIPAGAKRSQKKILQPDDLVLLFNRTATTWRGKECPDEYVHAYRIAVLTGMRPGEQIGLRWSDVVGNEIHIQRSINIRGEVTQGKNSNAVRTVVLSPLALSELAAQRLLTGNSKTVFEIENEQHYYKCWKKFAAHNGITPISLYEMRHTFVSVAQTLPEGMVKALVGHSKSMDTWGTYGHMLDGQQADTAHRLETTFQAILAQQNA